MKREVGLMSKVNEFLPSRREFIQIGSGALVVAALGTVGKTQAADVQEVPAASLGFWAPPPRIARRFRTASETNLVAADSLLAGDPTFLSADPRIFVKGIWRPEAVRSRAVTFALDVLYDAQGSKVPFYAWSFASRSSDSPSLESSHLAFNIPVEASGTMDMVLSTPDGPRSIKFSINSGERALKLRPGYYFVALPETKSEPAIDWTRVKIREGATPNTVDPRGPGILSTTGFGSDESSVPFSYLVLWVEAAPSQTRS